MFKNQTESLEKSQKKILKQIYFVRLKIYSKFIAEKYSKIAEKYILAEIMTHQN